MDFTPYLDEIALVHCRCPIDADMKHEADCTVRRARVLPYLKDLARDVILQERERAARVADYCAVPGMHNPGDPRTARFIAAAIRKGE
jgi:hypothetical protein